MGGSEVNLDNMQLPKVNLKRQKSRQMMNSLSTSIYEAIVNFQKENDYNFESYEIDSVLLDMIQSNHKSYLRSKFGSDTI